MPKLPPFALVDASARTKHRPYYLLLFFGVLAASLLALHLPLLTLPFYWDELGQFIPTALDLLRTGAWVAHSAVPNVHPPGVEAYLVIWYQLFGFSIPVTRVAMLTVAAAGLLFTFLLSIELSRGSDGAPAFLPPLLLLASPLFYTQSMLAQLDMPAMVLSLLALFLFIEERYLAASLACVALLLTKETGLTVPAVFVFWLLLRRDFKHALLFTLPAFMLGAWLVLLHSKTGYWLGDPGFAHYNVEYALNPVRILFSLLRRAYYLFFAEFRWIGTLVLIWTARACPAFRTKFWRLTLAVSAANVLLVSILGGAELERYILPVLPVFYIAVAVGITCLPRRLGLAAAAALFVGLVVNLFWNPPYPFPYENNYAMVDSVRLQQVAARYTETRFHDLRIATAWPFTAALRRPDYGFVSHPLRTVETGDFHAASIHSLAPRSFDVLITYTRTWMPRSDVMSLPLVKGFLSRFYEWQPDATLADCEELGLLPAASWSLGGQTITVYARNSLVY